MASWKKKIGNPRSKNVSRALAGYNKKFHCILLKRKMRASIISQPSQAKYTKAQSSIMFQYDELRAL